MNSKLIGEILLLSDLVLKFEGKATVEQLVSIGWTEEKLKNALKYATQLTAKKVGKTIIVSSKKKEN